MPMANRTVARRNLDRRFESLRHLANEPRPHKGWIRAIRDALGMSSAELGGRLGISQQTVAEFERNERQGTIQLETLRRVADALECEVAYFLIPRQGLEEMVQERAIEKAGTYLADVSHHSRLEDQQLEDTRELQQIRDLAAQFVDRRGLWSERSDETG